MPPNWGDRACTQASPTRVFGASAVRFVNADGAAYEPPVVFLPSDPPAVIKHQVGHGRVYIMMLRCWAENRIASMREDNVISGGACRKQASPLRDRSPWLGRGQSGSTPNTTSPSTKRTRSPGLQRDSLKQRYSPGRPGSRRHQRWSNDQVGGLPLFSGLAFWTLFVHKQDNAASNICMDVCARRHCEKT